MANNRKHRTIWSIIVVVSSLALVATSILAVLVPR
jgi:type IV secretory pathway component VirB8